MKSFLLAVVAGGIALSAFADHPPISSEDFENGDFILLHSRNNTNGAQSPYFTNSGALSTTTGVSSVGGNSIGSYFTSGHTDVVGLRSGTFTADIPVAGLYQVEFTWGVVGNRNNVNTVVTHAAGTASQIVDQAATANVWFDLGTFFFDAGAGAGVFSINNHPFAGSSVSSNMVFDSVRFTAVELIPEPSTYAAIFGGLALLGAFVYRRRMSVKK